MHDSRGGGHQPVELRLSRKKGGHQIQDKRVVRVLTGASARTRIAERVKAVSHRLAFKIASHGDLLTEQHEKESDT